jgi:hypothetical protein
MPNDTISGSDVVAIGFFSFFWQDSMIEKMMMYTDVFFKMLLSINKYKNECRQHFY